MPNFEKFIAVGDNHGEFEDLEVTDALFDFIKVWKPKYRFHVGDNYDFRSLRRKAGPEDEQCDLVKDWEMGTQFVEKYQPHVWCLGNHESRLWRLAGHYNGLTKSFAQEGIKRIEQLAKKVNCKLLPYHSRNGIYRYGGLNILHGYHAGSGAAKRHAEIYSSCLFGHVHNLDRYRAPRLENAEAISTGCLAKIDDLVYAQQNTGTLRWKNGWVYGVIDTRSTSYNAWQAEQIGGKWILPSDVVVL